MTRLIALIMMLTCMGYGQQMYVMSRTLNVMNGPSLDSKKIAALHHGDQVIINDTDGIWVFINRKETSGWVCKFNLVDHDPNRTQIIEAIQRTNLNKRARKRASAYSTAATTRGFNESEDKVATTTDYLAVKRMMTFLPTVTEIKDFMTKGTLKWD
ncbi:MAG: hypothetical protein ACON35_08295 [Candidatus Marinamargulisbacteria bacterium]